MSEREVKYHVQYQVDVDQDGVTIATKTIPNGLTVEQARSGAKEGWGACNALVFASILFPPDGSYSVKFTGIDGRHGDPDGQQLAPTELFKACLSG